MTTLEEPTRTATTEVVGHTDAVPVKSARGKQLFTDNRGLSSNRGDSVARVLIANGVPGTKMKPYKGKVTDADLDNMAAFVKSLR